ncbi:DivIVA domain-containing protein [Pseudokineococcus sp. 1T1Z-3]|uniref:DivIVA domain-containing protein n=1 Tax=Pseudokineococcus sp. 1T1Z-3 TaxID=3132745 RepID=UPI0030B54D65
MTLALLLVAVVVVGGAVAVGLGRLAGGLEEPTTSRPLRALPDRRLSADDIDRVRFSLGLRGYRMDEVDAALDRVRDEVAERDARLAELEAQVRAARPAEPPWSEAGDGGVAAAEGDVDASAERSR